MLQEPDLLNTLVIPMAVELVIFILKVLVVTLFAGYFVKRYVAPLIKKESRNAASDDLAEEKTANNGEGKDDKKES